MRLSALLSAILFAELIPLPVLSQNIQPTNCRTLESVGNVVGSDETLVNGMVCKTAKTESAQQQILVHQPPSSQGADFNNARVIGMTKLGLDDDIIIAKIKHATVHFQLEDNDLVALKKAGVSSKVVAAMLDANQGASVLAPVSTSQATVHPVSTSESSATSPAASAPAVVQSNLDTGIVAKQNVGLAVTIFMPDKNPEVGTHIRLAVYKMKVAPVVVQTMNHQKKEMGIDVKLMESVGGQPFTNAAIAFAADGETIGTPAYHSWTPNTTFGNYAAQTMVENAAGLVHRIANAKEAYLSVIIPGVQAPFNQMSFKLSAEQLANFKRMADKYDSLEPREDASQ
jgi:hypothetical protein